LCHTLHKTLVVFCRSDDFGERITILHFEVGLYKLHEKILNALMVPRQPFVTVSCVIKESSSVHLVPYITHRSRLGTRLIVACNDDRLRPFRGQVQAGHMSENQKITNRHYSGHKSYLYLRKS
jgi:hypothetical protein